MMRSTAFVVQSLAIIHYGIVNVNPLLCFVDLRLQMCSTDLAGPSHAFSPCIEEHAYKWLLHACAMVKCLHTCIVF